jgi:hypothetical protein
MEVTVIVVKTETKTAKAARTKARDFQVYLRLRLPYMSFFKPVLRRTDMEVEDQACAVS